MKRFAESLIKNAISLFLGSWCFQTLTTTIAWVGFLTAVDAPSSHSDQVFVEALHNTFFADRLTNLAFHTWLLITPTFDQINNLGQLFTNLTFPFAALLFGFGSLIFLACATVEELRQGD